VNIGYHEDVQSLWQKFKTSLPDRK
jgi:hypothetical protein